MNMLNKCEKLYIKSLSRFCEIGKKALMGYFLTPLLYAVTTISHYFDMCMYVTHIICMFSCICY